MRRYNIPSAVALLALTGASPAMAEDPCDTITFPATALHSIHTARVTPGPHATFLTGRGGCPNDTPACRQTAYVVPGNQLLTGVTHGPYTCAYYTNGKSETAGWLPNAQLQHEPTQNAPRSAWLGIWHYGDSTLAIRQRGANLSVSAQAYWPSRSDSNGHEGHLDAQAKLSGDTLTLTDPDDAQGCKLTLGLRANTLIAHDNNACGGANVTLSGIYRK